MMSEKDPNESLREIVYHLHYLYSLMDFPINSIPEENRQFHIGYTEALVEILNVINEITNGELPCKIGNRYTGREPLYSRYLIKYMSEAEAKGDEDE